MKSIYTALSNLLEIYFNIILLSKPRPPKTFLPFIVSNPNFLESSRYLTYHQA